MKAKTIKKILSTKFEDWVKSIEDQKLRTLVRQNSIITGGCIASMLLKEKVNDYDIYFTDKDTVVKVSQYYIQQFCNLNPDYGMDYLKDGEVKIAEGTEIKHGIHLHVEADRVKIKINSRNARPAHEEGFKFDEDPGDGDGDDEYENLEPMAEDASKPPKPKYRPVYLSANALTLSDKIQIVIRFYGDAETIHENYDFAHCKCYWTSKDKNLVLPASALEALLTKELIYGGSKYPLASIIRSRKFITRGFTINAGQYLKMCLQLNDLDLRHLQTLEDQLIGMDAVYFAQLMAAIPPEKVIDGKVDMHYIMTLIDRFF